MGVPVSGQTGLSIVFLLEGLEVSAETLMRLGERSILLSLCLYAPLSDEDDRKKDLLF